MRTLFHPISNTANGLLEDLRRKPTAWQRLTRDGSSRIDVLQRLKELDEPSTLLPILDFALGETSDAQKAAHDVLAGLLKQMKPVDVSSLDDHLRASTYGFFQNWMQLTPDHLRKITSETQSSVFAKLASLHRSGYVREEAIRLLRPIASERELPYLLYRLNDWVEPVRKFALETVTARLTPAYAASFVECLPLLVRIDQTLRGGTMVRWVWTFLKSEQARPALVDGLKSTGREVRRQLVKLAGELPVGERDPLFNIVADDPDAMIRLRVTKARLSDTHTENLPTLVQNLQRDPFPAIRREALTALGDRSDASDLIFIAALMDRNRGVREAARYYLKKTGFDAKAFYAQKIEQGDPKELPIAIRGFGESATSNEVTFVTSFLAHPVMAISRAAINAVAHLGAEAYVKVLTGLVQSPASGVSRDATNALLPYADRIPLSTLTEWLDSRMPDRLRHNALKIALRLSKWSRLPFLLQVASDSDENLASMAKSGLRGWTQSFNRSFHQPSASEVTLLREAWRTHQATLDEGMRHRLLDYIQDVVA